MLYILLAIAVFMVSYAIHKKCDMQILIAMSCIVAFYSYLYTGFMVVFYVFLVVCPFFIHKKTKNNKIKVGCFVVGIFLSIAIGFATNLLGNPFLSDFWLQRKAYESVISYIREEIALSLEDSQSEVWNINDNHSKLTYKQNETAEKELVLPDEIKEDLTFISTNSPSNASRYSPKKYGYIYVSEDEISFHFDETGQYFLVFSKKPLESSVFNCIYDTPLEILLLRHVKYLGGGFWERKNG